LPLELDLAISDLSESMLSDGRASDIPSSIADKLVFRCEASDVDVPPSLVLLRQNLRESPVAQLRLKHMEEQRLSQERDNSVLPQLHQSILVELVNVDPAIFPFPQAPGGNQGVQVRMEIQPSSEGMRHHHDQPAHAVFQLEILLDHGGGECRQIV